MLKKVRVSPEFVFSASLRGRSTFLVLLLAWRCGLQMYLDVRASRPLMIFDHHEHHNRGCLNRKERKPSYEAEIEVDMIFMERFSRQRLPFQFALFFNCFYCLVS